MRALNIPGIVVCFAIVLGISVASEKSEAAELVMLEQQGCAWCEVWNEEIGVAYPKTDEGKTAPLRRVDITDPWPEDLVKVQKEPLTPTFILVEDGEEVARLRGYPGEHFFWPMLSKMLDKLQEHEKSGS
nr:transcriptional regulator [Labrenzia sp. PHM005]